MKRRMFALLCAGCLAASLLTGCGSKSDSNPSAPDDSTPTTETGDQPTYKFRVSHLGAVNTWYDDVPREMVAQMNEKAGYEAFQIETYTSGQLAGSDSENAELVNNGTVEMTFTANDGVVYLNGSLERWNVISMPFIFPNEDAVALFYDSEYGKDLIDEATNATDVIVYPGFVTGSAILGSNKGEIHLPADIAGQKIRTTASTLVMKTVEAWGATAINVSWGETYSALQQGTVDGMINGLSSWFGGAFGEVCKYGTVVNSYINNNVPLVNKAWYNSLTPELQGIFDEGMAWLVSEMRSQYVELSKDYLAQIDAQGMKVISLTDEERQVWVDASAPVVESQADNAGGIDYVNEVQDFISGLV